MGINTKGAEGSNRTYLSVFQNKIVLEYSSEEKLTEKLDNLGLDQDKIKVRKKTKGVNEGQEVFYYELWNGLSGMITNIVINETDWGILLEVELTDVDDKFIISLGDMSSRIGKDFIRRVGNLDLTKEVDFNVWHISEEQADNGKSKSGVKMYQDGIKVDYSITWDDMPPAIEKKKGRKTEWDFSEQETYLDEKITKYIESNFKPGAPSTKQPAKKATPKKATTSKKEMVENDDLPF